MAKFVLVTQDGMVVMNGGPAARRGTQALPRKAELVQLKHLDHAPLPLSLFGHQNRSYLFSFFVAAWSELSFYLICPSFAKSMQK